MTYTFRTPSVCQSGSQSRLGDAIADHENSLSRSDRLIAELAELLAKDSPERRQVVDDVKPLILKKFAEMAETIRLCKSGKLGEAINLVHSDQGETLMQSIERVVERADRSERAVVASIAQDVLFHRNVKISLTTVSAGFTILILVAVYLVVGREMWERKQVEEELARTRDVAEAANRAKGDFMANVSHEIRTPMNAILGMTELTLETDLAPHQRENLTIVKSATDSLLSIINDLLDFSKMEAGKLSLALDDFDLRDLLSTTMDLLALRAVDKGLELACRIDLGVPDRLVGDSSRIRQVVMNLVGNAIKFTEQGEVIVEVEAEIGPGGAIELHFKVTDSGIGIDDSKLALVFDPFTQADGSTTRLYGGSGLGLSISSQLAALMGGRIWVESVLCVGSTFHFTAHVSLSSAGRPQEPAPLESLRGLRVLVVDDNAVNRQILEEMLTFWEMVPTLADGGRAALDEWERAREQASPFSLVILDALMPDMDGFTLARMIQQQSSLKADLIVMLTSSDRQGFAESAREAGITACLNKPIHQHKLLEAILATVTGNRHGQDNPVTPPASKAPTRTLRILLAEDNPHNQRVAVLILAKFGHAVTVAANGVAAVDLLRETPFDLVLMDLQMPLMDGLQATAAIRAFEAGTNRRVPIIALTAHAMKEDENRCLAAGMDGYVTKPIEEAKLVQAINHSGVLGARTPAPRTEPARRSATIDAVAALARVDGDRAFLAEMATLCLTESTVLMREISDAVALDDGASLIRPAHSLKNWSGNFVAETTFASLRRLEELGRAGRLAEARAFLPDLEIEVGKFLAALAQFLPEQSAPENDPAHLPNRNGRWSPSCTH